MAKHPRKKQKTSKGAAAVQPLGAKNPNVNLLTDDASKDDEERRLESMLFGTKFVPRDEVRVGDDEDGDEDEGGGREMGNLLDKDLFFVDDGIALSEFSMHDNEQPDHDDDDEEPSDSEPSDSGSEAESSSSSRPPSPPTKSKSKPSPLISKSRKPPAWTDPSDPPTVAISTAAPRLRKLRDAPGETTLSGREYESRLRRQYERIHPEPEWAKKARGGRRAVAAAAASDEEEGDNDAGDIQDLLSSTTGILAPFKKTLGGAVVLSPGTLAIERLRDANQAAQGSGSGEVKVVAFHPSDKVPVLCVGTADRRVRLFNIDGHTCPLLQTLHVPSLPLTSQSSVSFHPLGSSLLLTGPRPFFYTHDLQTGLTSKHARGLWGTTFSSINDPSSAPGRARKRGRGGLDEKGKNGGGGGGEGMEITAFSPHTGDILAVAGRGGYVHLVDWKSGAGQVVGSLKCAGGGGGVRALWWAPDRSSTAVGALGAEAGSIGGGGRQHLAVLSGDAEVYLWDVGERRCVRRWKDEGGFRGAGRTMAGSAAGGNGGWLAVGSNTGFVNVYGSDSFAPLSSSILGSDARTSPKPIKQVANLTTAISTVRFNHDAQLMAIASQEKKDAMRLIHLPSLTSFANWPTSSTPLGHVTAVDFSAQSEYLAVGNTRGRVLLYHLKDYGLGL